MFFSDDTNKLGIIQEIITWCFGNSANDDTTAYPLADKTRNVNNWYDRVVSLILQSDARWEWDDINQTDLPIATTALVQNQKDYGLDAAVQYKIARVEILDRNGDGKKLKPISEQDRRRVAMSEYKETAGTPVEYDLDGNSIFLYPKTDYSKSLGLKIYFQRGASYFTSSDTTKVPGFNEMFHRILTYGPAYDFALANGLQSKITIFRTEIDKLEEALKTFYADRHRDSKLRMRVERTNYGETNDYSSGHYSDNIL